MTYQWYAGDLLVGPEGSPRYAGFNADGGTYLSVVPSVAPLSDAGETLVKDVRDTTAPLPARPERRMVGFWNPPHKRLRRKRC